MGSIPTAPTTLPAYGRNVPRAPYEVLVFPFRECGTGYEFAVFLRSDAHYWQGIAGGGEDSEFPLEAARREATEEAGFPTNRKIYALDTTASVSVLEVAEERRRHWPGDLYVIPIYAFGLDANACENRLSSEHKEFRWCRVDEAADMVRWDSDRTALLELNARLTRGDLRLAQTDRE